MREFEPVIGLEVHAQLNTKSKIFCGCPTRFGAAPNTQTCPVCQGHPGVLPVLNKEVLTKAVIAGLAVNGEIARYSKFDRKNYFYPDLPKAYQISQYDMPIVSGGKVDITLNDGTAKTVHLTRIHMEEDAGKLIHPDDSGDPHSYVDLNRCGTPLIEIVSEPDMNSVEEAVAFLNELRSILLFAGVSDCSMEQGSLRCDVNISIRPRGDITLGTRAEIKNMNSFSGVAKALEYEIKRQTETISAGETIVQETRLFDVSTGTTRSMRSKENAPDYRYFPDPDLVPIELDDSWIQKLKEALPELPAERKARYKKEYKLSDLDVSTLCATPGLSDYFERAVAAWPGDPKKTANWIQAEILRVLNDKQQDIVDFEVSPENTARLCALQADSTISGKIAKKVFPLMIETGKTPDEIIKEHGLEQVTDNAAIEKIVDDVLKQHPAQVEQYKSGKTNVLGFFVGQVMKASKGKANPQMVNSVLTEKLSDN